MTWVRIQEKNKKQIQAYSKIIFSVTTAKNEKKK
jgi:hypothetical protein